MVARVPGSEPLAPWDSAGFRYRYRAAPGADHPALVREPLDQPGTEQVLLDLQAVDDRAGTGYCETGHVEVSPDGRRLAWSVDLAGDEVYGLRFRDLASGEDLPEVVTRTYYGGAWSSDSAAFLYTVHDAAYRPYQVWHHVLGTDPEQRPAGVPGGRRALRGRARGVPYRCLGRDPARGPGHERGVARPDRRPHRSAGAGAGPAGRRRVRAGARPRARPRCRCRRVPRRHQPRRAGVPRRLGRGRRPRDVDAGRRRGPRGTGARGRTPSPAATCSRCGPRGRRWCGWSRAARPRTRSPRRRREAWRTSVATTTSPPTR